MKKKQDIENLDFLLQKIFEKKPNDKNEAIGQLALCEKILKQIKYIQGNEKNIEKLKNNLSQTAISYVCNPILFQKYRTKNLKYNKKNHIIEFKDIIDNRDNLTFLNSSIVPGNYKYIITLLLISIYINPNNFIHFKERELNHKGKFENFYNDESSFKMRFIETIYISVDSIIKEDSGLDKTYLEKFIPRNSFNINPYAKLRDRVILNLFTLREFRSSKEIIKYILKESPEYFKKEFFKLIDKKLFDDDEFLFDVAKNCNNYLEIPFGFASERIKKNKLFALCACSFNGENIKEFDNRFLSDREVVMVAISNLPLIFMDISPDLQKDKLIFNLALINEVHDSNKNIYKDIYNKL